MVRGSRHGTPFDAVRATNAVLAAFVEDRSLPGADRWICDATEQPICFAGSLADEHAASGLGATPVPVREVAAIAVKTPALV